MPQLSAEWTPLIGQSEAAERQRPAVCLFWPHIYVLGGRIRELGVSKEFWRFNLETLQWSLMPRSDVPLLEGASLTCVQEKLYVFGGQFLRGKCPLWVWKRKSERLKTVAVNGEVPLSRRGHSLLGFGADLVLFGGYVDLKGSSNETWIFRTAERQWQRLKARGPSGRHFHSAVVFSGWMWVYGGLHDHVVCSDFWRFNLETKVWEQIRHRFSPGSTFGHSACVADARMYLFGGEDRDGVFKNQLWCFSFNSMSWNRVDVLSRGVPPSVPFSSLLAVDSDPAGGASLIQSIRRTPEYLYIKDLEESGGDCRVCKSPLREASPQLLPEIGVHHPNSQGVSVSRNGTQTSADSGFLDSVAKFSSSRELLISSGRQSFGSADSRQFIANPAFEPNEEPTEEKQQLAASMTPVTLPGSIASDPEDDGSALKERTLLNKQLERKRASAEHQNTTIQMSHFTNPSRGGLLQNNWIDSGGDVSDSLLLEPSDPPPSLCSHTDQNCVRLLLMAPSANRQGLNHIPSANPMTVWLCCLRAS